MPAYLALMRDDAPSQPSGAEWSAFFAIAASSGAFRGGSALGDAVLLRRSGQPAPACGIGGFMRFEAESVDALRPLLDLHPWLRHGGTIEVRPLVADG